jgi:RNase P/RNase MRP subunit POP5
MVVKEKRGRRRYIRVRVRGEVRITEDALYASLNSSLYRAGIRYKVIQFDGLEGILRVGCKDQNRAIEALNDDSSAVVTIKTSGTLRTLREGMVGSEGCARGSRTDGKRGP